MVQRIRQPDHNVKKKNKVVPFLVFLNVLLWGSAIYLWFQNHESRPTVSSDFTYTQEIEPFNVIPNPTFNDHSVEEYSEVTFSIHSNYALLINLTTGDVLFAHNERERAYPASITKIMTVLVALEHAEEETLTVQADFNELYIAQAATAGFEYGETRTLSEVLHGAMLPSGADATSTIAYHFGGDYQGFVDLMNATALRLGMFDTHFTNASGLHDDDHYTTAFDIAILLEYALQVEGFREVFTASFYPITTSDGQEHIMNSTMFRSIHTNERTPAFSGGEILGGKDGFTHPAGLALASLATDGMDEYILITLRAPAPHETEVMNPHVVDAFTIYEYFLNEY